MHSDQEPPLAARRKPFYRARPLWIVPFAITSSIIRGMTIAPRVEVLTQLSCNALHHNYNHTNSISLPPEIYISPDLYPILNSNVTLSFTHNIADDDNDDEEDPRRLPSSQCLSDPAVQAGAARLQTIMTTTLGLLSALTTGWWGHFGERHGRTTVLTMVTLGLSLTDLVFILVSTPGSILSAHHHKLLILAPFIEGFLGSWSTLHSTASAYVSDCTSSGSRAHVFARFNGIFYMGFSIGPIIGGWFIRHPISGLGENSAGADDGRQSVTSVFWLAIICSFLNLLLVAFVIPESLSKEKQAQAQLIYSGNGKGKARVVNSSISDSENGEEIESAEDSAGVGRGRQGIIKDFLDPLAVFLPKNVVVEGGKKRKDWSLTVLVAALFGYLLSLGIYQNKYLYAEHVYGWGAEQLSYYLSFLGGARATYLLFGLPLIITTFKPKPKPPAKSKSKASSASGKHKSTPALIETPVPSTDSKPSKPPLTKKHLTSEIQFDLNLARFCLLVDLISHTSVSLAPAPSYKIHTNSTSSTMSVRLFVMATALSCVGSGMFPATQSLALCILHARSMNRQPGEEVEENISTGKLFGALAVVEAVAQLILGPILFGLIYSSTVATFPKAIFVTAAGILVVALSLLFLVRVPGSEKGTKIGKQKKRKVRDEVSVERGRSRVSKDLRNWGILGSEGHVNYGSVDNGDGIVGSSGSESSS